MTNEIASQQQHYRNDKMLPPLLVFKGAKNGRIMKKEFPTFDNSTYYACQENAWMDK